MLAVCFLILRAYYAKRICRILCMSLSMDNIPELSFQICEELRAAGSILRVQHVSTVNSLNYFNKIFKECNSQKFRLFKILPYIGSYWVLCEFIASDHAYVAACMSTHTHCFAWEQPNKGAAEVHCVMH